ncbi:MAG: (2Fe-2S)-binding protein [Gammaproteobacteria bacterium]|nr:(2Fe-2S)-binding protein [Gammaproteobacteria bacterium]
MSISFLVNGIQRTLDADPSKPLLWVIREELGLTGTKFGCGISQCGACTVQVDGEAIRSCVTPISMVEGKQITTIEGLSSGLGDLHPLQQAWIEHQVPQCGYCQSGQLMSASALLASNPNPTDSEIDEAMEGNICRCGMYGRIRTAIKSVNSSNVASSEGQKLYYNATEVDYV